MPGNQTNDHFSHRVFSSSKPVKAHHVQPARNEKKGKRGMGKMLQYSSNGSHSSQLSLPLHCKLFGTFVHTGEL